jgi:hypothetical protein
MATDNALSCLGRLIEHHPSALGPDPSQAVNMWLQGLPIKGDTVEAQVGRPEGTDLAWPALLGRRVRPTSQSV